MGKNVKQPIKLTVYRDIFDFYLDGCVQSFVPTDIEIMGRERMATEEIDGDCNTNTIYAGEIVPSDLPGVEDKTVAVTRIKSNGDYPWVGETITELQAKIDACCIP